MATVALGPTYGSIPLNRQREIMGKGRKVFEDAAHTLREVTTVEERSAFHLKKALRNCAEVEIPGSTLQTVLSSWQEFLLIASRNHGLLASKLRDQCTARVEQVMAAQGERVMRAKMGVQITVNAVVEQEDRLTKVKREQGKMLRDEHLAVNQFESALHSTHHNGYKVNKNELDRLHGKVVRLQDHLRRLEADVQMGRQKLYEAICARDEALRIAGKEFEASERERVSTLAEVLRLWHKNQREFLMAQLECLSHHAAALDLLRPEEDVDLSIRQNANPDFTHSYGKALSLMDWAWGLKLGQKRAEIEAEEDARVRVQAATAPTEKDGALVDNANDGSIGATSSVGGDDDDDTGGDESGSSSSGGGGGGGGGSSDASVNGEVSEMVAEDNEGALSKATDGAAGENGAPALSNSGTGDSENAHNSNSPSPTFVPLARAASLSASSWEGEEHLSGLLVSTSDAVVEESVMALLPAVRAHHGRCELLKSLNDRRHRSQATELRARSLEALGDVLSALLDACEADESAGENGSGGRGGRQMEVLNVKSVRQVMNFGHTFYALEGEDGGDGDVDDATVDGTGRASSGETPQEATTSDSASDGQPTEHVSEKQRRRYLQAMLKDREIWGKVDLWETMLKVGVQEALEKSPQTRRWDDLDVNKRREAVLHMHNTVFAQLGSMALNMAEYGFPIEKMEAFLAAKCAKSELSEDQVLILNKDLARRKQQLKAAAEKAEGNAIKASVEEDDGGEGSAPSEGSVSTPPSSPSPPAPPSSEPQLELPSRPPG